MDVKVTVKAPRLVHLGDDATLKPGVNLVSQEVWRKWSGHLVTKAQVAAGELIAEGEIAATRESLTELDPRDAIALVKDTFDSAQLKAWAASESRAQVKVALKQQLSAVTPEPPKEE